MAADYAGAVEAIAAKFVAEWVAGDPPAPRTRIGRVNEPPAEPWPPKDDAGKLQSWVLLSIEGVDADHPGFGTPGNQVYKYDGLIYLHCFAAIGQGDTALRALAVAGGEIFRAKLFYNDVTDGCYVRTWAPRIDGGGPGDDDGVWFRITATIPFEYYHRG